MLNIGRLAPGAADYYVGEIATSAEDYYTGHGEAPGRWVGSLAASIGLSAQVDPEHLRAALDGRHPLTSERLSPERNQRLGGSHGPNPNRASLFSNESYDLARAASRLRLSVRQVRRLLLAGDQHSSGRRTRYLRGRRVPQDKGRKTAWRIDATEIERYEATHLSRKARPGYDLTLRPPKSVSVLWALADEPTRRAIRQVHTEAVDAVVAYVEEHALYARKRNRNGGRDHVGTDGVIAAAFDHRTSRAGDPLLHTHVVTANLTRTVDGRWQAIDGRPLFDHARPAGMLYQAHLRHLLTSRVGVQWGPVHNGWAEIDGVPRDVVRAFSKRRDEIEAMVAESGYTSARAQQAATLATRQAKDYGVDPDRLVTRWRAEAATFGFGPDEVAACFGRFKESDRSDHDASVESLHRFLAGPEGLTRHASTFTRKEVLEAVCDRVGEAYGAAEVERVVSAFLDSDHVTGLSPSHRDGSEWVWRRGGNKERDVDLARWTTPELVRLEDDLRRWSRDGFGVPPATPDDQVLESVIAARRSLNDEQAAMVRGLATPAAPSIQPVAGRPGSGKTFATATYVRALVASGVPVLGCALAATAAAELESSCRFGPLTGLEASTIARLLYRLRHTPLTPGAVVVVDEASMVGTRDLHRLATHVAAAGGSMKLIGDPQQHGAVETGGFFKHLTADAGDRLIRLEGNRRQQADDDRRSIEEFRQGLVEAALARYDTNGRVHRSPTAAAAYDLMVDHWFAGLDVHGGDPMIAGPNRVRRELNRRARQKMRAAGRLDGPVLTTDDGVELQAGDWIVTRRNQPGLRSAAGGWVKNGSAGIVTTVDVKRRTVTVEFRREGTIVLRAAYLDAQGWVEHGYARTTYGVQGATLDRALYFAGDEASFEEGYVAFTRGRTETHLYLVDGTAAADEDTASRAHSTKATGLDTVAAALGRERANELVHDADPDAAAVRHGYHGWRLDQLRAERTRIEAILTAGPPDVTDEHNDLTAQRDGILAHQRAIRHRTRPTRAGDDQRLDRALANIDARLAAAEVIVAARNAYLLEHSEEVTAYRLVRRAELARDLELRAAAAVAPPHELIETTGGPPANPIARRAWTDAAELIAVHAERFGLLADPTAADPVERTLGLRPPHPSAALSWTRAADALNAALATEDVDATTEVAIELPQRGQAEPSLFG